MNEIILNSATVGVVISLAAYGVGVLLKKKLKMSKFNPMLISIVLVIVVISVLGIDYDSYNESAKYISYLLTPATVALAIPLYQQIELLKKHIIAIIIGIASGVITSLSSVLIIAIIFNLSQEEYVTLLPKSITTAIGMGLSEEFGGIVSISVAVIIITGVFGNMVAEGMCKLFRIKSPISRGLAIGTAAHAVGTAKAMEMGEIEGAMSSLAIVVAGLGTVIAMSFFSYFLP